MVGELHLIDVFSGPDYYCIAQNGDEFYVVTIAYYTRDVCGNLTVDNEESLEYRYFCVNELPDNMVKSHRRILEKFIEKFTW